MYAFKLQTKISVCHFFFLLFNTKRSGKEQVYLFRNMPNSC